MAISDSYCRHGETGMLSSGVCTADTAVKSTPGKVFWITISEATGDISVELNDSTDDSGTDLWQITLDISVNNFAHIIFDPPLEFATGIYLDASTETCQIVVGYL